LPVIFTGEAFYLFSIFSGLDSPCLSGFAKIVVEERIIMTTKQQLELGFNGTSICRTHRRRGVSAQRAQWWFARMREAVQNAWPESASPRSEQT